MYGAVREGGRARDFEEAIERVVVFFCIDFRFWCLYNRNESTDPHRKETVPFR